MVYRATSGWEVATTDEGGGVKLPEPQPTDVSVSKIPVEKQNATLEFFKLAHPLFFYRTVNEGLQVNCE